MKLLFWRRDPKPPTISSLTVQADPTTVDAALGALPKGCEWEMIVRSSSGWWATIEASDGWSYKAPNHARFRSALAAMIDGIRAARARYGSGALALLVAGATALAALVPADPTPIDGSLPSAGVHGSGAEVRPAQRQADAWAGFFWSC